jgi:hypothetical protein
MKCVINPHACCVIFFNIINKPGEKFEFSLLMHEINVLTN